MLCDQTLCTGCRACENKCPTKALTMKEDREGFLRPFLDESLCIHCGRCETICPILNIPLFSLSRREPETFACWSLDETIRERSSSGGVFSLLAREILKDGGVVFGASFDEELRVRHTYIEDFEKIDGLRRSKYVQSDTGNSYQQVETFLKTGRPVLFVGSPCQVAGLASFLGQSYENLLTLTFISYGVPSPKVFKAYIRHREEEQKERVSAVSFRDKRSSGWSNCAMCLEYQNGTRLIHPLKEDPYYVGVGRNLFTRPSCFECRFRHPNTPSDITMGDFWGADRLEGLRATDDRGVSLVLTHTPKGEEGLKKIAPFMFIQRRSFQDALAYNPRLMNSSARPAKRHRFFEEFGQDMDFSRLIQRYMKNTGWKAEIKKRMKALLGEGMIKRLRRE